MPGWKKYLHEYINCCLLLLLLPQEPQARTGTFLFSLSSRKQQKDEICPQKPPLQAATRCPRTGSGPLCGLPAPLACSLQPLCYPGTLTAWALLPRNNPLALPAGVTRLSSSPGKPCVRFSPPLPLCPTLAAILNQLLLSPIHRFAVCVGVIINKLDISGPAMPGASQHWEGETTLPAG